MTSDCYTAEYYAELRAGSRRSAEVIVPLVLRFLPVRSVVDVGCGEGAWLGVFHELGVEEVLGVDGNHIVRENLQIGQDRFRATDLSKPFWLDRTFDLAISMEVAEHLPPESADEFISSLTRLAPVVLFSAAIPFQGGNQHVNEQWQDRWAELFRSHKYFPVDCIRRQVWANPAVEWWYAQNALLYVRNDFLEAHGSLKAEFERTNPEQLNLVHPRQYLYSAMPNLRSAWHTLLMSLGRSVRFRLGRPAAQLGLKRLPPSA